MKFFEQFRRLLRRQGTGAVLARGASSAFAAALLSSVVGLGLQILTVRLMGRNAFGTFIYVWTWLGLLASFAVAGWDTVVLRYLPTYKILMQWDLLRGLYRRARQATLVGGLLLSCLMALVVFALKQRLASDVWLTFLLGCAVLPILGLLRMSAAVFRGLRRVVVADLPDAMLRPALVLGMLGAVFLVSRSATAPVVMALQWPAAALAYLVAAVVIARRMPRDVRDAVPAYRSRQWLGLALPTLWMTTVQTGMNRMDLLLLGMFAGTAQAGVYAIAVQFARLIGGGLGVVLAFIPAEIAELHARGRMQELQRVLRLTGMGLMAVTLPLFFGLILTGRWLLGLYGPGFEQGYWALVILSIGQLADALSGPNNTVMLMTGHERQSARILTATAVLNLVLNLILVPRFGMLGAAASSAATLVTWNVALVLYLSRHLGLQVASFGRAPRLAKAAQSGESSEAPSEAMEPELTA
jgi:O-antigen/teichoic acid export membrane protein